MSEDQKITDILLFGNGKQYGDLLCREQRTFTSSVWDDEWTVFGDQVGQFGENYAKHVAVQFRRRPSRGRYTTDRSRTLNIPIRIKELEGV